MSDVAPVRYVVYSTVRKVEEIFDRRWAGHVGPTATFTKVSLGWFIWIAGSYEAIHVGNSRPSFAPGDKIKITFEKVPAP